MPITGLLRTYDFDSEAIKPSVEEMITRISPADTPLFSFLNRGPAVTNTKFEWLEDELPDITATLGADVSASATTFTIASGEAARSRADSSATPPIKEVWRIGEEMILVTDVDTAASTWTVTRGYGGTTASTHSQGDKIYLVSRVVLEGTDAIEAQVSVPSRKYNYTQIFTDTVKLSGTAQVVDQYGGAMTMDRQVQTKLLELGRQLERAILMGVAQAGSTSSERTTGGFFHFISTNKYNKSGASLTEAMLLDAMQDIWDQGGSPDLIVVNSRQKRAISALYGSRIRAADPEVIGGVSVDKIVTDFGTASILLDRWLPQDEILVISPEYVEVVPLAGREFFEIELAVTGDSRKVMIVGEYGVKIRAEKAHARIYNLATS